MISTEGLEHAENQDDQMRVGQLKVNLIHNLRTSQVYLFYYKSVEYINSKF